MTPIQTLPSFELALQPDHYKTVLPNLAYPSRPSSHITWSGSSAPLFFTKTTRPDITVASTPTGNIQVPSNTCFDTCSVPDAFYRVGTLIWHKLSMFVQQLKLIKEKLFGRATTPSVIASV